ncbi:MAG: LuxR C-terminal-related transcriptional regulator [Flavobacteriales bacterium]
MDPALLATLLERYRLTARECEYIVLVCRCPEPTVAEMAEHMDLRPKAVETHRAKVYDKLGVGSTIEVLGKAVQFGLVRCVCQRGKEQ